MIHIIRLALLTLLVWTALSAVVGIGWAAIRPYNPGGEK